MTTTVELTEGGKPLPSVTTWDKFYQAALRAQIITNPMDEVEALLLAQEVAAEDGIQLRQVPAVRGQLTWGLGVSARRSQTYWFQLLTRMGMEVKT